MSYGKSDSNQDQIVKALRGIGAFVRILSGYHAAGFDLLVGYRGKWVTLEVKRPKHLKLTEQESEFCVSCSGKAPYYIVTNEDEAIWAVTK